MPKLLIAAALLAGGYLCLSQSSGRRLHMTPASAPAFGPSPAAAIGGAAVGVVGGAVVN